MRLFLTLVIFAVALLGGVSLAVLTFLGPSSPATIGLMLLCAGLTMGLVVLLSNFLTQG